MGKRCSTCGEDVGHEPTGYGAIDGWKDSETCPHCGAAQSRSVGGSDASCVRPLLFMLLLFLSPCILVIIGDVVRRLFGIDS